MNERSERIGVELVIAGRRARNRRRLVVMVLIGVVAVTLYALSLMFGNTFYGPVDVLRVIFGDTGSKAARFAIHDSRLPRATLGLLTGVCFGVAGSTFQTLLRNPLASPDVIGISSGASAAAVIGIITFSLGETAVSLLALCGALATAAVMYLMGGRGASASTRVILIGIGLAAMLQSVVSYVLARAAQWDLQEAMQWLTGSLNGATWRTIGPLAVVTVVFLAVALLSARDLGTLRLGDDSAAALGVRVQRSRAVLMLSAVVLLAFATAAAGPIAFVAFMAGPIAARLVGAGGSTLVPAGLVGAALVLGADLVGQNLFDHRYPVGIVTGVLGAPYLLVLLTRINRSGGSL